MFKLFFSLLISLIFAPKAFADVAAVQKACANRLDAKLISAAVIGVIENGAPQEIYCGNPVSSRVSFEIGSISKSFAGILAAKLSLQKRLDLEAPLSLYVPELRGSFVGTATVHQLATHTARLVRSYTGTNSTSWNYDEAGLIGFLKAYKPSPIDFPVGSRTYSNLGFGTLALVLSRVSGLPYQQLLVNEILKPLALNDTGAIELERKPLSLAQGYDLLLSPLDYWGVSDLAIAAGGVYSDLHDMLIFLQANLIPDKTELGRAIVLSQNLGLGWDSLPGTLPTWKNGLMADGFATMIAFDPSRKTGTIVLSNIINGPSITAIGWVAMGSPDKSHQLNLEKSFLASVSGSYSDSQGKFKITVKPFDQRFLGIELKALGVSYRERLLSIAGETSRFSVDNGIDTQDQIEFSLDPISKQMQLTYFRFVAKASDGQSTFESETLRLLPR
jgi:CubicO group peptidase (beta-lactamase class C family)